MLIAHGVILSENRFLLKRFGKSFIQLTLQLNKVVHSYNIILYIIIYIYIYIYIYI